MTVVFFMAFFFSSLIKIQAMEQSALYRNKVGDFSVGDFRRNDYHYLWATKIASAMVADYFDCTFLCVGEPKCYSFNMAVYPDSKGLHLCELLATDKYKAANKLHANATFHHYSPWSPCESGPCMNGADCVPDYQLNSYHCDCRPGFRGIHCELGGKTCSYIKSHYPTATTGSYLIDPDGEGGVTPFTVHCDMTDKNGVGVTVISHDSEDRTLVNGYNSPGTYSRDVHYTGASLAQLASLTSESTHCEQFIKYECHGSWLLNNGNQHGWWVSRDGSKMKYWGGVTSGDYKCACGLTNTCADPSKGCNCDKNDAAWREDSGLLTNKIHLPVSQLRFGDTDASSEQGYHTLGKLKCDGMSQK